jgi:hypothetical protein
MELYKELVRQRPNTFVQGSPRADGDTTLIDGRFNLNVLAHRILKYVDTVER